FFARPTVVISRRIFLVWAMSVGGVTISALAAEPIVFPLWNTVSPNGHFAVGWSTPGSTKKLPQPYETDSGLENWLINVQTRERIVKLPNSLYWSLPSGTKPNHYDLIAAWARDSSAAVILLDWWSTTDRAFYAEPAQGAYWKDQTKWTRHSNEC
ncbi:MAG: hypothetical protein JO331_02625, partial [Verrucomicrobia bacterium]|nr:hypothetical protein [Verrucomicrobiota bacterium]